jgi:hypothetical protein
VPFKKNLLKMRISVTCLFLLFVTPTYGQVDTVKRNPTPNYQKTISVSNEIAFPKTEQHDGLQRGADKRIEKTDMYIVDTTHTTVEPLYGEKTTCFLILDHVQILLDSISIQRLKPDWIRKIVVNKSEKDKLTYGNTKNTVFLYTKKRYDKQIKDKLVIN